MHSGRRVREARVAAGWTQAELARRAGLSRAQVSAIETERSAPSVIAALALARTLGTSVELLFGRVTGEGASPWAWPPVRPASRFWLADVAGEVRRYPVEPTGLGLVPHDGVGESVQRAIDDAGALPERTLVLAGCDPAVGLLAAGLSRDFGVRLLPFVRASRRALELLRDGRVAVAGLHLGRTSDENLAAARAVVGDDVHLLRLTRWEEGIALSPGIAPRSPRALRRRALRWVGREEGSGARSCLDELFEGAWESEAGSMPRASDHRGVAEAIRAGWAQAGVCVRLAADEAGLHFVPLRREAYDLCYPARLADDPRIRALRAAVRARRLRRALGELPGYEATGTGNLRVAGGRPLTGEAGEAG